MDSKSSPPKNFTFRIRQIAERSFFLNIPYVTESRNIDSGNLSLSMDFDVHCKDLENNLLTIIVSASYYCSEKKKKIKVLESSTTNQFEVKNINELIDCRNGQTIEDKSNIIPILLNISISTMRGIMLTRTAGTPLAAFPLPVIDVRKVIQQKEKQG